VEPSQNILRIIYQKSKHFSNVLETPAFTFISCIRKLVAQELDDSRIYVLNVRTFCWRPTLDVGVWTRGHQPFWNWELLLGTNSCKGLQFDTHIPEI